MLTLGLVDIHHVNQVPGCGLFEFVSAATRSMPIPGDIQQVSVRPLRSQSWHAVTCSWCYILTFSVDGQCRAHASRRGRESLPQGI